MITSINAKRVFALEIGGLLYRYHSTTPPASTSLETEIASGINYVDREGILTVGSFSASLDPSGGIGEYSPLSVSLAIDKKADLGDAGVVFGRCGARSSGIRARLTESADREATSLKVDTNLTSLSFPRLMHIGGETVRVNSASTTTLTVSSGRGAGNTPVQSHSIDLEGTIVPEVTEYITTFRGRRAKLYGANQYQDGSVSDYVEIINGFIESSPTIEDGQVVSLSIVPLSAMIDTSLSDKISQTHLLSGYHYFDGQFGSSIEYATELNKFQNSDYNILAANTSLSITANTFNLIGYNNITYLGLGVCGSLEDFDATLPAGVELDTYTETHPRYPKLQIEPTLITEKAGFPTAVSIASTTSDYTEYTINADSSPSNSLTASEITNSFIMTSLPRTELKRHELGNEEVKKWPAVINDTLESSGASSVTGLSGAVAKWRIDLGNKRIITSKTTTSIIPASLYLWTSQAAWSNYTRENYPRSPQYFDANGNQLELDSLSRLSYPIDIGQNNDPYPEDFRDSSSNLVKQVKIESGSTSTYNLRDIASAYYQLYEKAILVESSLGLPTIATAGEFHWITVRYYDRVTEETRTQFFQVSHETTATFGGSDVGYLLHLRQGQDYSANFSFGDWSDSERALIFRGGRFVGENAGVVLLQLLESGGGDLINGDYDVLSIGLNIDSSNIDEESFLSIGSGSPFLFSDQYAGDGQDLRSTFESILRLLGACLVMKRDSSTGRSKIALVAVGAERSKATSLNIQAGDFFTNPAPTWNIYEDIVTQIEFKFDYDPVDEDYRSTVIFNDQEAINRYGGERSKITLDLPGVSSNQFGRGAGDIYSQFIPTANRIFSLLANPLRTWTGSIATGSSIYLDLGSYVKASSPHFRDYSDSYGVVDGVAMIRSINQNLQDEGCDLEFLISGLSPVAWNSSATVASIVDSDTISINASDYSSSDIEFFSVGDVVDFVPIGDQDNSITGLEMQSISGNQITFTSAHGISSANGTIEPTTYANASTSHKEDAYLSDSNNLLNSTDTAQDYS